MSETIAPAPTTERTRTISDRRIRSARGVNWGRVIGWTVMILLLVVTLFPFYWMLRTAVSSNPALMKGSQSLFPQEFTVVNFKRVLGLASAEEIAAAGGGSAT